MSDIVKPIDLTKSFLPVDPNILPENLIGTGKEDSPAGSMPIIAFEGENFLPTMTGYKSYFGTTSKSPLPVIDPTAVYRNIMFQTVLYDTYGNQVKYTYMFLHGLYSLTYTSIASPFPWYSFSVEYTGNTMGQPKPWKPYVIGKYLFFTAINAYSSTLIGYGVPANFFNADGFKLKAFPNTGINTTLMAGQFKAGSRRGYWDTAGAVFWSNPALDNFTPDANTLTGFATFPGVTGNIITIEPMATGFIIYTTKTIVGVRLANSTLTLWDSEIISESAGIEKIAHVTTGLDSNEHYAWTSQGFIKVGKYQDLRGGHEVVPIWPEMTEYLRRKRANVELRNLNSRYIFIQVIDTDVLNGYVSTYDTDFPAAPPTIPANFTFIESPTPSQFPLFKGAFVYDLRLEKWGKFVGDYYQLVDFQGITNAMPNNLTTDVDGVDGGVIKADGYLYAFTPDNVSSWIRWGKIGFYRQGFTKALEVRAHFASPSEGNLTIDCSMDGRDMVWDQQVDKPFEYTRSVEMQFTKSAKWFNIKVSGQFDIQYLEFRGNISGKR